MSKTCIDKNVTNDEAKSYFQEIIPRSAEEPAVNEKSNETDTTCFRNTSKEDTGTIIGSVVTESSDVSETICPDNDESQSVTISMGQIGKTIDNSTNETESDIAKTFDRAHEQESKSYKDSGKINEEETVAMECGDIKKQVDKEIGESIKEGNSKKETDNSSETIATGVSDKIETEAKRLCHNETKGENTTTPITTLVMKDNDDKKGKQKDESVQDAVGDDSGGGNTATNPTSNIAESNASDTVTTNSSNNEYAEHITYIEDGSAVYTDPKTQHKYKWSAEENNWVYWMTDNVSVEERSSKEANPYENEHYRWCSERKEWVPKTKSGTLTETEHYKWDAVKKAWIPKVHSEPLAIETTARPHPDAVTYGIDKDGERIYTDRDGVVFIWDAKKNAWFPKIDDDFMARYQMNYGFIDNTSASDREQQLKAEAEEKRKAAELQQMADEARAATEAAAAGATVKRKAVQQPATWFDLNPDQNTKVYVSNLPLDITLDEFAEVMSKCGMIMRDTQTQKFKLKLYTEADGQIKGDGLCDYIKVESVDLALKILDEYEVRGHKIRVQRARFQMRGEYNPALKPKRKKKDKEKLQKMKEKLFDWRPEKMRGERSKNEKVVIIKNLFTPDLFEKEVQLILDYQNDLREECAKCGTVRKVVIYDLHPEGVAQINMSCPEEADVVIKMMHGRYFGQRQLTAEHWDGKTKYKIAETTTAVKSRLNNWDSFLESDTTPDQSGGNTAAATAEQSAASSAQP